MSDVSDVEVRVSVSWLRLREEADAAARSRVLVREVAEALSHNRTQVIHDLGAGSGSLGRWIAPRLPGPQHWVLHDRDEDLLWVARHDVPPDSRDELPVTVEARRDDLTRLSPDDVAGASLITASALLDMLTADELERVVRTCVSADCPTLFSLTVLGHVELSPPHPLDDELGDAFNDHQRRTVGGRTLLGPDAGAAASGLFAGFGSRVLVERSPWELDAHHGPLIGQWLTGWVGAAVEQRPELRREADAYLAMRRVELAEGRLRVRVDHVDVLALPGGERAGWTHGAPSG
ncbi:trans-aconitate methyltransferase [Knoellia sinensis KCTC 19936]|uniref:Trans-aconitate methyltransferase n=1 Tax=Knoellia sinensis KCTC 19936 TaxID=1385520 RepID=A0A0A0J3B5_9MICO|nr:class I SAM-dependent methyltransferase [Knoellia sinensis]KGN31658.1 trans-aconitate methyltransferase [Knoellia sinensis KCTC 19936]